MDKADVRRQMRTLKRQLDDDEKQARSRLVTDRLEALSAFQSASTVLLYWSMDDEVQTHQLVDRWHTRKRVLLPCVDGNDLRLRQYTGRQCLRPGEQFGIGEPTGDEFTRLDDIELIAVPGVAFDLQRNRMGRGRGFYDRLLKLTPRAVKVGLAFSFQVLDAIPVEPFDVPMDCVVSEHTQF